MFFEAPSFFNFPPFFSYNYNLVQLPSIVGYKWHKRSTKQRTNNSSWGSTGAAWSRCRSWWVVMMISQHCTHWGGSEEDGTSNLLHLHCGWRTWSARNSENKFWEFFTDWRLWKFAACWMRLGLRGIYRERVELFLTIFCFVLVGLNLHGLFLRISSIRIL